MDRWRNLSVVGHFSPTLGQPFKFCSGPQHFSPSLSPELSISSVSSPFCCQWSFKGANLMLSPSLAWGTHLSVGRLFSRHLSPRMSGYTLTSWAHTLQSPQPPAWTHIHIYTHTEPGPWKNYVHPGLSALSHAAPSTCNIHSSTPPDGFWPVGSLRPFLNRCPAGSTQPCTPRWSWSCLFTCLFISLVCMYWKKNCVFSKFSATYIPSIRSLQWKVCADFSFWV